MKRNLLVFVVMISNFCMQAYRIEVQNNAGTAASIHFETGDQGCLEKISVNASTVPQSFDIGGCCINRFLIYRDAELIEDYSAGNGCQDWKITIYSEQAEVESI